MVTITIKGKNEQSAQEIESVCSLIDLAGSERLKNSQVKGDQLKETKNINTSLHHLKSIISNIGNTKSCTKTRVIKVFGKLQNRVATTTVFFNSCYQKICNHRQIFPITPLFLLIWATEGWALLVVAS